MKTAHFNEMAWPLPDAELEWRLRYAGVAGDVQGLATIAGPDRLAAASIHSAYAALLAKPRRERDRIIAKIRAAQPTPKERRP